MAALAPKKKTDFSNDFPLRVDLHSHLLVGIDDGAASEEEALQMVRCLMQLGYTKAVTTPHVRADVYPNTDEHIEHSLSRLQKLLQAHGISFRVEAAAEYFFDDHFLALLAAQRLRTFGQEGYVLFELPLHAPALQLHQVVFDMRLAGYKPVLAHPERYPYLVDASLQTMEELREKGVLFQVNLPSILGHYGFMPKQSARRLMQAHMVDFLGTDMHRAANCTDLQQALELRECRQLLQSGKLLNNKL